MWTANGFHRYLKHGMSTTNAHYMRITDAWTPLDLDTLQSKKTHPYTVKHRQQPTHTDIHSHTKHTQTCMNTINWPYELSVVDDWWISPVLEAWREQLTSCRSPMHEIHQNLTQHKIKNIADTFSHIKIETHTRMYTYTHTHTHTHTHSHITKLNLLMSITLGLYQYMEHGANTCSLYGDNCWFNFTRIWHITK